MFNFKKWWFCNLNAIWYEPLYFSFQNVKAQRAMMEMRGFSLKGSRLQTDYASHECRARFFELCKKYGIDIKERSRPWEEDNSQDSSYRYYVNPQLTLDLAFHSWQFVMDCTLRFQMKHTNVQKVTRLSKSLQWIQILIYLVISDKRPWNVPLCYRKLQFECLSKHFGSRVTLFTVLCFIWNQRVQMQRMHTFTL